MNEEDLLWIKDALKAAKDANDQKTFILLVRRRDDFTNSDEETQHDQDIVITNANGNQLYGMAQALNGTVSEG